MKLHHVQLTISRGSEDECRTFYCDILGWREIKKPPVLAARGGMWMHTGNAEIHLGVEEYFRAARRAHPGIVRQRHKMMLSDKTMWVHFAEVW